MKIGVVYAEPEKQIWLNIDVPEGITVKEAIVQSGILNKFPQIDIDSQKVGVFGKITKLDAKVSDGDRIEIYRPITADPLTVKRRDRDDEDDDDDD